MGARVTRQVAAGRTESVTDEQVARNGRPRSGCARLRARARPRVRARYNLACVLAALACVGARAGKHDKPSSRFRLQLCIRVRACERGYICKHIRMCVCMHQRACVNAMARRQTGEYKLACVWFVHVRVYAFVR
eukprot:6190549-Pleurochrysis_carterae.AAC.1